MSPTVVGRRRKFWFLEALKTAHWRLKINTRIKISQINVPNLFLRLSFTLANRSATSIKERLSTILVCAFKTDKELHLF